jgi:hypothetical protein
MGSKASKIRHVLLWILSTFLPATSTFTDDECLSSILLLDGKLTYLMV